MKTTQWLSIILICATLPTMGVSQEPFHWEITNVPGGNPAYAFEVAPNGDICMLVDACQANYATPPLCPHFFRRSGMTWREIPLPHEVKLLGQITFGTNGSPIFLLDTGLLRQNPDGGYSTIFPKFVRSLTSDFSGNIFIVVGRDSILSSSDEGNNWSLIPHPPERASVPDHVNGVAHNNEMNRLYATTDSALFMSTDMGQTWTMTYRDYPPYARVNVGHDARVWVISDADHYHTLYFRLNDTSRWEHMSSGNVLTQTRVGGPAIDRNNIALVPTAGSVSFVRDTLDGQGSISADGLAYNIYSVNATLDSNGNWYGNFTTNHRNIVQAITPAHFPIRNDTTWHEYNGAPGSNATITSYPFGILASDPHLVGIDKEFLSTDRGDHWTRLFPVNLYPDTFKAVASSHILGKNFIGVNANMMPLISFDSGESWKIIDSLTPQLLGLVIHSDTLYALRATVYNSGLYRSTDTGRTWQSPYYDPSSKLYRSSYCVDSSGKIYAGGIMDIWKSSDFGQTWNAGYAQVGAYNVDWMMASRDQVFANDQDGYTYRSGDGGKSWMPISHSYTENHLVPNDPKGYFNLSSTGLIYVSDTPEIPHKANANLGDSIASMDLCRGASGELYLSTFGGAIYRSVGNPATLAVTQKKQTLSSLRVFPNPANRIIWIDGSSADLPLIEADNAMGIEQNLSFLRVADKIQCDVSQLPSGHYWLQNSQDGVKSSVGFVIER